MDTSILQGEQLLLQLPACAQPIATSYLSTSPCGLNFACICTSKDFLFLLETRLPLVCSTAEIDDVLALAKPICLSAVPGIDDDRGGIVNGSIIVCMVLATVFVGLRIAARKVSTASLGWDDWLILVSLVFGYISDVIFLSAVPMGFGRHTILQTAEHIVAIARLNWLQQLTFGISITTTKLSILFLYSRIFPSTTFHRISIYTGIFLLLWLIAFVVTVILSCIPVAYFWDKSIPGGKCIKEYPFEYFMTAVNIATDVLVLVLPVPWIWKLQMRRRRKWIFIGMFLMGGFVCVAAIVRMYFVSSTNWADVTYTFVYIGIWLNIESNIGILSACLPVLHPLLVRIPPLPPRIVSWLSSCRSLLSEKTGGSSGGGAGSGGSNRVKEIGGAGSDTSNEGANASHKHPTVRIEGKGQPTNHADRKTTKKKGVLTQMMGSLWEDEPPHHQDVGVTGTAVEMEMRTVSGGTVSKVHTPAVESPTSTTTTRMEEMLEEQFGVSGGGGGDQGRRKRDSLRGGVARLSGQSHGHGHGQGGYEKI